jgi:hypothetical protein
VHAIWKGVTGFFRGVRDGIIAIFSNIGSFFKNIFGGAWNGIKNIWSHTTNGVKAFFSKVWDWISTPFKKAGGWFKNIFTIAVRGLKGCWNGIKEWASNIWGYIAAPFKKAYGFFKDTFEKVAKKIKEIWGGIKDFILEVWETIKSAFGVQKVQTGNKVIDDYMKKMSQTPKFANGGLVNEGQMFIAREAGPELVGTIGNRTAVMNNDQIVESVAMGVADANAEQNALLREEISILRKILAKDYGSGSGGYGDILSELNRRNRRNGKTLVSIGI